MRHTTVIILAGTLLLGCGPSAQTDTDSLVPAPEKPDSPGNATHPPDIQTEIAKLEGKWSGVSFHIDGFEQPATKWYKYTFSGDQMTTETNKSEFFRDFTSRIGVPLYLVLHACFKDRKCETTSSVE